MIIEQKSHRTSPASRESPGQVRDLLRQLSLAARLERQLSDRPTSIDELLAAGWGERELARAVRDLEARGRRLCVRVPAGGPET